MTELLTKRDIAREVERPVDWVSGAAASANVPMQIRGGCHLIPAEFLRVFREAADRENRMRLAAAS